MRGSPKRYRRRNEVSKGNKGIVLCDYYFFFKKNNLLFIRQKTYDWKVHRTQRPFSI